VTERDVAAKVIESTPRVLAIAMGSDTDDAVNRKPGGWPSVPRVLAWVGYRRLLWLGITHADRRTITGQYTYTRLCTIERRSSTTYVLLWVRRVLPGWQYPLHHLSLGISLNRPLSRRHFGPYRLHDPVVSEVVAHPKAMKLIPLWPDPTGQ